MSPPATVSPLATQLSVLWVPGVGTSGRLCGSIRRCCRLLLVTGAEGAEGQRGLVCINLKTYKPFRITL